MPFQAGAQAQVALAMPSGLTASKRTVSARLCKPWESPPGGPLYTSSDPVGDREPQHLFFRGPSERRKSLSSAASCSSTINVFMFAKTF